MSFQTKRENTISPKGGKQTQVTSAKGELVFSCVKSQYNPERKSSKKLRQFKENHSIVRYIIQEVQANKSVR